MCFAVEGNFKINCVIFLTLNPLPRFKALFAFTELL